MDDIAPIYVRSMYIGGNHGDPGFIKCVCTHDKTAADIGSVWTDGTYQYTIVIVENGYIVIGNVDGGKVVYRSGISSLTHVSGGTHTDSITVTSQELFQLNPCGNQREHTITDENGLPIEVGKMYDRIVVHEWYNILDAVYIISYLQTNVGNNDNTSYYDNDLTNEMLIVDNVYEFNRNGSVTIYSGLYFKNSYKFGFFAVSQCETITTTSNGEYAFVPDSTNLAQLTQLPIGSSEPTITVEFSTKLPYRYYEILTDYSKGFGIVYNPEIGYGKQTVRADYCSDPGEYRGRSGKLYPYLYYPNRTVDADSYFSAVAARMPIFTSATIPNLSWYWIGNDIVLMVDIAQGFDGFIDLPDYMDGMLITAMDVSEDVTVYNDFITSRGLKIKNNGTGILHAVLKLSKGN